MFRAVLHKTNLETVISKWPVALVALGMALTVLWMAAVFWFFISATGYAATSIGVIG